MARALDTNVLTKEAREAINAVVDALSEWREEVSTSTERFSATVLDKMATAARAATRARNVQVGYAAADASALPFKTASVDSTFCVAVLQHLGDVSRALKEFARVTKPARFRTRDRAGLPKAVA